MRDFQGFADPPQTFVFEKLLGIRNVLNHVLADGAATIRRRSTCSMLSNPGLGFARRDDTNLAGSSDLDPFVSLRIHGSSTGTSPKCG